MKKIEIKDESIHFPDTRVVHKGRDIKIDRGFVIIGDHVFTMREAFYLGWWLVKQCDPMEGK